MEKVCFVLNSHWLRAWAGKELERKGFFKFKLTIREMNFSFTGSGGGAACPGATWGQPPPVWFKQKKILWQTDRRTDEGWTHRREGGNSGLDNRILVLKSLYPKLPNSGYTNIPLSLFWPCDTWIRTPWRQSERCLHLLCLACSCQSLQLKFLLQNSLNFYSLIKQRLLRRCLVVAAQQIQVVPS